MKPRNKLNTFSENMSNSYGMAWDVALGTGGALLAAVIYVAVFALCVKLFHISENALPIVNQVSKVLCILFGAWLSVRRHPVKGWLRGGLAGLLYVLLAFVVFSAITGDWAMGWPFLTDALMGAAVGAIGGMLFVNLRKNK